MPIGTPFHPITKELCTSYRWKDWAGYHAVCSYDICHEPEYFALRHAVGMIDVTPLFKYDFQGAEAAKFLSFVMSKDIKKLKQSQATYCCWCDEDGKIIDDGTVTRLEPNHFRVTTSQPNFSWFSRLMTDYDVTLDDITEEMAALSVQGPNSRELLKEICDANLESLKFFYSTPTKFDGFEGIITRTGYTGDLGYELWVENQHAIKLYQSLLNVGPKYGLLPVGLDAMDVTRIESGFILNGVDYYPAHHCLIEDRKSSPYEIGLGWTVQLDRDPFLGQEALMREKSKGSKWSFVGIEIDWDETEATCFKYGLPPQVSSAPWRTSIPIYSNQKKQVGYATSGSWSPLLKKNLALATIESDQAKIGNQLKIEITVEHHRELVTATIAKTPFFNPERKRYTPSQNPELNPFNQSIGKKFELEFTGFPKDNIKKDGKPSTQTNSSEVQL